MEEEFCDVAALRTDGQGPAGGPQGEPLQYQDQAPVPAEPVQRHFHLRRAGTERAVAGFDQRDQVRRSPRRLRRIPDQSQGSRAVAPRARVEAPDREEDRSGSTRGEGELRLSANGSMLKSLNGRAERSGCFCFEVLSCARATEGSTARPAEVARFQDPRARSFRMTQAYCSLSRPSPTSPPPAESPPACAAARRGA